DGADGALWEQSAQSGDAAMGDINGDGLVNSADRQILYANHGLRTNQAPVAAKLQDLKTHTDLDIYAVLRGIAEDLEGDGVFWRVLGATHGSATLASDGQTLHFIPEDNFSGQATILLQADDGFATGAPIALTVNVSAGKLLRIDIERLAGLFQGSAQQLSVKGDFVDEQGVTLTARYLNYASSDSSVVDVVEGGWLRGKDAGHAIVTV